MSRLFCAALSLALLCAGVQVARADSTVRVGVSARDLGSLDPATGIGNGDEFPIRQLYNAQQDRVAG